MKGRGASLHWTRGKRGRMCRSKCAHRFGKGRQGSSFLVVLILPVKEKKSPSREEEDVEMRVVGGLRRLRKWAEAKEAAVRTTVSVRI